MKKEINKFNDFLKENISDVNNSEIIISKISSSMEWDITTRNPLELFKYRKESHVEKGIITVGKWTKLEGGTFSIWKTVKPIFQLLNTEEIYHFMLGKRIQIDQTRFESGFENIQ